MEIADVVRGLDVVFVTAGKGRRKYLRLAFSDIGEAT